MHTSSAQEARRWATAAIALAVIVCAYHLFAAANPTTIALTLLLLVLALARWGLRFAVATSLVATLCYNYFFLPPIGTLTIADPQNWLTLFAFLATSVIGSRLAEQARREAEQARGRQRELTVLYQLGRELLQADDVSSLLTTIAPAVQRVTSASAVTFLMVEGQGFAAGDPQEESLPEARRLLLSLPASTERLSSGQVVVPLRAGVRPRGLLLLRGTALSTDTLDAVGGLVSISMDRAQALEEVTRTRTAQESERMRKVMIDAVTHELRTPLTAIKAAVTTLTSAKDLAGEDERELLSVIDEEADRLNRLVARAVEVTQLEAHDAQMLFAPVSAAEIAHEALDESAVALGRHVVEVDVSETLPLLCGDAAYLAKVLSNLLENAAKYSRAGSLIRLEAQQQDATLVFSIHDRGVGIDSSELGLIFDRLYRAKTQSDKVPGTGMGLAISRSIAEAHGGTLQVASVLGEGSVFRLALPLPRATELGEAESCGEITS